MRRTVIYGVVAFAALGTATTAAQASPRPVSVKQSITQHTGSATTLETLSATRATSPFGPDATGPGGVITCTMNVQYPHKSTHVPGTINIEVIATCVGGDPNELSVTASLYQPPPLKTIVGKTSTVYERPTASSNAANTGCYSGTYQGHGAINVIFPAGYEPNPQQGSENGKAIKITC